MTNPYPKTEIDHVKSSTFFWILGTLIAIQTSVLGTIVVTLNDRIDRVDNRASTLETRVENLNVDIRNILVGIEQVKARLGIVENTHLKK